MIHLDSIQVGNGKGSGTLLKKNVVENRKAVDVVVAFVKGAAEIIIMPVHTNIPAVWSCAELRIACKLLTGHSEATLGHPHTQTPREAGHNPQLTLCT